MKGSVLIDLPVPYNAQGVVANNEITISWKWQPPEQAPAYTEFGFEVRRHDGKSWILGETSFTDRDLAFGQYTYRVRARGASKGKPKQFHTSQWSEPVTATVKVACGGAPSVKLNVRPTQRVVTGVPQVRMQLKGTATVPEGCTLGRVSYSIDSGTGINHAGNLKVDSQGRFDEYVEALGPDDEVPAGAVSFTIHVTAEDEAGPTTSDAYTITVELQNKFAPQTHEY